MRLNELSEEDFSSGRAVYYCRKCGEVKKRREMAEHLVDEHEVTKMGRRDIEEVPYKSTIYEYNGKSFGSWITRYIDVELEPLVENISMCRKLEGIRCPSCGQWGAYGKKALRCPKCGNRFKRRDGAFMDGIFLDRTTVDERYEEYLREGCERLEVSDSIKERAKELLKNLPGSSRSGRSPKSLAAGAVYLASLLEGKKKTQFEVSKAFSTTEYTIRSSYKLIEKELGIIANVKKR